MGWGGRDGKSINNESKQKAVGSKQKKIRSFTAYCILLSAS
jgi:hypothetical protein